MEWLSIYLVSSNASILPNPNLEFFLFYTTGVLSALFHLIFKKKEINTNSALLFSRKTQKTNVQTHRPPHNTFENHKFFCHLSAARSDIERLKPLKQILASHCIQMVLYAVIMAIYAVLS